MSRQSFENAFKIPLFMRRARAQSITFSFFNEDGTDYNEFSDGRVLHFYIRQNPTSTPLVDLVEADGLTVSGNDITAAVTVLKSTRAIGMYWWELYDSTNSKTLGMDRLQISTSQPIPAEQTVEVSMYDGDNVVNVTVSMGGIVDHWRGGWDASGDTFPTTGGSGAGGAIAIGDRFYISNAAGGNLTTAGAGAASLWPQYSIAEYLGSSLWRLT
jgi:hypothetical protein